MRLRVMATLTLVVVLAAFGCAQHATRGADWIALLDASGLEHWNRVGDANWRVADGVVQADRGEGYLVSKNAYGDFALRAEFWVDAEANSGIFIRCADPSTITPMHCYEINIFDKRPDPSYGTGAIVGFAPVFPPLPRAAGRWNTYEITARGPRVTVTLNGVRTVELYDASFQRGPVALQYGGGVVKFRKVQLKPL